MRRYTRAVLDAMPTLSNANGSELKIDGIERHWLEPPLSETGGNHLPYEHTVIVEQYVLMPGSTVHDGWATVEYYNADDITEATPGPYAGEVLFADWYAQRREQQEWEQQEWGDGE